MLQLVIPYGTRSRVTVIASAECRWSFLKRHQALALERVLGDPARCVWWRWLSTGQTVQDRPSRPIRNRPP